QRKKCVGVSIFPNSSRIRTDFDQIPVAPRGIDVLQQTSEFVVRNGFLVAFERLPARFGSNRTDIRCCHDMNGGNRRGQNKNGTIALLRAGVSVVRTGDHIWDQKAVFGYIDTEARLLRAINYPEGAPGHGAIVLNTSKGKVGVINVQTRTFMLPILGNPFHAMAAAVTKMHEETNVILVDVHGETTSEKIAIARFLDGKVSAVIGTHTHVQTADEQIFPGGTAFLCDAGMCGPINSILGRAVEPIVQRFISNLP